MTREELNRRVAQILSARHQRAVMQAEERRREVYDKQPRFLTLDNLSISEGIKLAQISAAGASKFDRNRQKEKLSAIAKERTDLLAEMNLPADYLSEIFICSRCKDTGKTPSGVCTCARQLAQRLRREEINANFPLNLCSFDSFSLEKYSCETEKNIGVSPRQQMEMVLRRCKEYAEGFGVYSPSLYLFGDTGIGKTHLALSIANECLKKGFHVVYTSSQNIFFELANDRDNAAALMETLTEADLLVLDDLGTELVTPFVISMLYSLVDTRMGRRRPTIYTTNITRGELLEKRYTEKISSRLLGGCEQYMLLGDDIRLE